MLAMDVNDNAGSLMPRGAWVTIASKLAPTKTGMHISICDSLGWSSDDVPGLSVESASWAYPIPPSL
ncbi:hypothetical protein C3F00_023530 [Pseudomonas sp. MWU13-2860]|nr:hypothetical protein C3F00_023530 [Pseudomonas sp. MWU13-2860]